MNARFNMNTPEEAAKIIGVTSVAITNWCRDGRINCNDVSNGSKNGRYEIEDDEVRYIRKLVQEHGSRNMLMYYKKNWRDGSVDEIDPDKLYTAKETARIIHVDKSTVNLWCRTEKVNCITKKRNGTKGRASRYYLIPGWELTYIKWIFDTYGHADGNKSPMVLYYKKKVEDRGDNFMEQPAGIPWTLEQDTEVVEAGDIEAKSILNEIAETTKPEVVVEKVIQKTEDDDDELLNSIIRIREVKARKVQLEEELKSLTAEYSELKEKIIGQL